MLDFQFNLHHSIACSTVNYFSFPNSLGFRGYNVHLLIPARIFHCLRFAASVTLSSARLVRWRGWFPLPSQDFHPQDWCSFLGALTADIIPAKTAAFQQRLFLFYHSHRHYLRRNAAGTLREWLWVLENKGNRPVWGGEGLAAQVLCLSQHGRMASACAVQLF